MSKREIDYGFVTKLTGEFDGHEFYLTKDLVYCPRYHENLFRVPAGFSSDGASIPAIFWAFVGHPFDVKLRRPAVLHDWLYYIEERRSSADALFYESLVSENNKKAALIWAAVRVFGGAHKWKESIFK